MHGPAEVHTAVDRGRAAARGWAACGWAAASPPARSGVTNARCSPTGRWA
ncbi:hypothetical protein [Streptomyces lunalinharesii]